MDLIFSSGSNGPRIVTELIPEWISVGYSHADPASPVNALAAVGYKPEQIPVMKLLVEGMRAQGRTPVFAIFDDTVQVIFSVSPLSSGVRMILRESALFEAIEEEIEGFYLTSIADFDPNDNEVAIFEKCYKRDQGFTLLLVEVSETDPHNGETTPFERFRVTRIERKFQTLV